jgi:hypothetical protein
MDGAGAACGNATAEFRSRYADVFAQHPEQRRPGRDVDVLRFAIEGESHHANLPARNLSDIAPRLACARS